MYEGSLPREDVNRFSQETGDDRNISLLASRRNNAGQRRSSGRQAIDIRRAMGNEDDEALETDGASNAPVHNISDPRLQEINTDPSVEVRRARNYSSPNQHRSGPSLRSRANSRPRGEWQRIRQYMRQH